MRRANLSLICLFILLGLLSATVVGFRGIGRWLIREDPLSAADAIVILGDRLPYPAEEAAKIFRMGYAPQVWLSRPDNPGAELEKRGIHFVSCEEYNRQILTHGGVPEAAVRILPDTVVDTEQEIKEVEQEIRRTGKTRVMIVTSPEHTRRVRSLWKRLFGENPMVTVRAASETPYDPDHWWRNAADGMSVVHEMVALTNDWAGLPARPRLL